MILIHIEIQAFMHQVYVPHIVEAIHNEKDDLG